MDTYSTVIYLLTIYLLHDVTKQTYRNITGKLIGGILYIFQLLVKDVSPKNALILQYIFVPLLLFKFFSNF